jgi:hypothetical protein
MTANKIVREIRSMAIGFIVVSIGVAITTGFAFCLGWTLCRIPGLCMRVLLTEHPKPFGYMLMGLFGITTIWIVVFLCSVGDMWEEEAHD